MRKLLILPAVALAITACGTPVGIHTVAPNTYLVCDKTQDDNGCEGANPEKGIEQVCLPRGLTIASIKPANVSQGILVKCGGPIK